MAHSAASHVALNIFSDSKMKCLKSQQEKAAKINPTQSGTKSRRAVLLECVREVKVEKKICFLL